MGFVSLQLWKPISAPTFAQASPDNIILLCLHASAYMGKRLIGKGPPPLRMKSFGGHAAPTKLRFCRTTWEAKREISKMFGIVANRVRIIAGRSLCRDATKLSSEVDYVFFYISDNTILPNICEVHEAVKEIFLRNGLVNMTLRDIAESLAQRWSMDVSIVEEKLMADIATVREELEAGWLFSCFVPFA